VTLDASGNGTLDGTYSRVVYGLPYDGIFKTVKLAYGAEMGTAIGQNKLVKRVGLVLSNSCLDGISIGMDENNLDPFPDIIDGAERTTSQFFTHYDQLMMPIPSDWDADSRVYVKINSAEGPVTIQALVMDVETRDHQNSRRNAG
jgi:hypothetical protein